MVAVIDEVCEAERDDYLRLFSRHRTHSPEALWWLNARRLRMTSMENLRELEGYDDLVERLLSTLTPEERLIGLRPEDVLGHYKPEERLAGLPPEDVVQHGLERLLSHLRALPLAERADAIGKLAPVLQELVRKYLDEIP